MNSVVSADEALYPGWSSNIPVTGWYEIKKFAPLALLYLEP